MKYYHFIAGKRDRFGHRQTLWNTGNYQYEIEAAATGNKIVLSDTSFEDAKRIFEEVCVSY